MNWNARGQLIGQSESGLPCGAEAQPWPIHQHQTLANTGGLESTPRPRIRADELGERERQSGDGAGAGQGRPGQARARPLLHLLFQRWRWSVNSLFTMPWTLGGQQETHVDCVNGAWHYIRLCVPVCDKRQEGG